MRSVRHPHPFPFFTAGSGSPAGVLTHPSAPVFTNVPAFSSRKASWSSARLFMTIGPCCVTARGAEHPKSAENEPPFRRTLPRPRHRRRRPPACGFPTGRGFSVPLRRTPFRHSPRMARGVSENWRCPRKYRRNPGGGYRREKPFGRVQRQRDIEIGRIGVDAVGQPPISAIIAMTRICVPSSSVRVLMSPDLMS